jgi:hypothetical protein
MRNKSLLLLLLCTALAAGGCGSSNKQSKPPPPTNVLPQATTPDEWAQRIVNRFLRPLNKDLQVLNGLNSPEIRLYIASQNPTTIRILNRRLHDLQRCSAKLVAIGPPPVGRSALTQVNADFTKACTDYVHVAQTLLKAVEFLTSGRTDVIRRGQEIARSARDPSGRAADQLVAGIRIAQKLPEFRRAGLKPSI